MSKSCVEVVAAGLVNRVHQLVCSLLLSLKQRQMLRRKRMRKSIQKVDINDPSTKINLQAMEN